MTQDAATHECHVEAELKGAVRIVHVPGRLDWVTAPAFRDRTRDEWTDGAAPNQGPGTMCPPGQ
jgi:hypothetical protein